MDRKHRAELVSETLKKEELDLDRVARRVRKFLGGRGTSLIRAFPLLGT